MNSKISQSYTMAGMFTLSLRLVVGWTYFSAFWRRLILANKLDPETAGYIGEKFNHFLPNALGIKPIILHLVENPDALWWAMVSFTIIEGIVGLLIMLGFFTRLMSIGVFGLAMGILLGSGWIGTTCLDEWQIGVLGIATGFTLFLTGSGRYSLDYYMQNKAFAITKKGMFSWLGSGEISLSTKVLSKLTLVGALGILFLTLFTNQYFHGGVWGTLHNKSVKPIVEISNANIKNGVLNFEVFRVEGVDVYGSFLIGIEVLDFENTSILSFLGAELSQFTPEMIENVYVAKVKPGAHSLIIPLGARAELNIKNDRFKSLKHTNYTVKLTDISGITWEQNIVLK
ncbi:TQO small subunit DoxD [uncultured Formosa sp.]|uniref:TQO small subunit DoxD n=1 Tax=uncultured Formosa sp. TaxID=255435 RepID=UPI00261D6B0C|nr:TQO small subunit DoxD [uncultured Formosa sp.]